ncbi:hypothetical protein NDU88_012056 [Pleurodeles waltl]|uniref:Uncharacterized protein n=1 Tax=Pleurodeles waltl TaxID=8319 RepID=A0AAV7R275_PLEWA|nr:hypothetical protein NDU88_012056 [Pleurodeles waltl]
MRGAECGREADTGEADARGTERGSEVDAEEADAGGEDAGPDREKPKSCTRVTVRQGRETRPTQRAERPEESHPAGHPRQVSGWTWLDKARLYFKKGRPLFKERGGRERERE